MGGVPESGPPVVVIDGREVAAKFSTNGICSVETEMGQPLETIGADMNAGKASHAVIRALFRSLFVHEVPNMTPVEAGKLLQALGNEASAAIIQRAFEAIKVGMVKAGTVAEPDQQGRVSFEAGGIRYVLSFDFNAMAEMDAIFPGMSMVQIANELLTGGVSLSRMRAMFRAAVIDQVELSLWQAGDLIDRLGLATVSEAVGKAFNGAFPKVPAVPEGNGDQPAGNRKARRAAGEGKGNPTKARRRKAGTGTD